MVARLELESRKKRYLKPPRMPIPPTGHMAVRVGFEPTEELPSLVFKTSALNQTRPSHRVDARLSGLSTRLSESPIGESK